MAVEFLLLLNILSVIHIQTLFFPDKFTYVEGWKAIQLANQIFGFNGWSSSVVDVTPDFVRHFLSFSLFVLIFIFSG